MPSISNLSIVPLLVEMRFGDTNLGTATAFATVKDGNRLYLITNRHVVTGRNNDTGVCIHSQGGIPDNLVVWHNAGGAIGNWLAVRCDLYDGDLPRWIEHPTLGEKADFVALPIDFRTDINVFAIGLGVQNVDMFVGPADPVSVIGFPFGFSATGRYAIWSTGFMASEPDLDQEGLPLFYIDCRSRKGQSGSPVYAHRNGGLVTLRDGNQVSYGHEVSTFLGVYSGRLNEESDIGRVWKREAIEQLVVAIV